MSDPMLHEIKVIITYDDKHTVEHVVKVGDLEAALSDLTAYCGIPVDVELTHVLTQHVGWSLIPPGLECGFPLFPNKPYALRALMAALIEKIKESK